ncbi:acyl--CoA ligase [Baekduia soli]|uniref:Acyl--CoA ligase n=1 Tax=Baekduia soli TaxID=496014 RepID=A0A5B8U0D4_9ACTN|nr:class I adenylate-forming enzyme family protein [Baekduia soli]QEC46454.1 acyl--CoA ligase [Baekduia soli]
MSSAEPLADTIGGLLRAAADRWPGAEVVVAPGAPLTFGDLDARADRAARLLLAAGVRPGDAVGILLGPGADFLAVAFGALRAGATVVPVNERSKAHELRHVVAHAQLRVLVTSGPTAENQDFVALLQTAFGGGEDRWSDGAPLLRSVLVLDADGPGCGAGFTPAHALAEAAHAVTREELAARERGPAGGDIAMIMYTSGTSAEPKGCMVPHGALVRQGWALAAARWSLGPGDAIWCPLPLFHNGGWAALVACLSSGAGYCHTGRFEPSRALRLLAEHRCTHAVPAFETIWLRILEHPDFAAADLGALRIVVNVGTPERLRQLQERIPHVVQLSNYGAAEATGYCTMTLPSDPLELRLASGGHPLPGMEVRVVEPGGDRDVAAGVEGEILFRGSMRFAGYFRAPELTAAVIDDEGWFHSGDLGRLDADGRLTYTGRIKDMMKVGGENVSAAEVETFLATHPAVAIAQVVGVPDRRYVEVCAAFVQLRPGAACTERELIDHCLGRIATYKVPRYVRFVEQWPMSATKIRKGALRERLQRELDALGVVEAPAPRAAG